VRAFALGTAFFAVASGLLMALDTEVFSLAFGAVCVAAILAIARRWGVAYAVPIAMVTLLAYDWYVFPPTHEHGVPSRGNLADLAVYLATSVLIGELAAHAERARGMLADEHAALRRVATLAAREAPPSEVIAAIVAEVGPLLSADGAAVVRCEGDGAWDAQEGDPPPDLVREIERTRGKLERPSAAGVPIVVEERVWGAIVAWSTHDRPLHRSASTCLPAFAHLAATAVSTHARREALAGLAREQAALHRVATLVAREAPPEDVLAAVVQEAGEVLDVDAVHFEQEGETVARTSWSRASGVSRGGPRVAIDDRSVSSPIVVGQRQWGVMVASRAEQPLPADTETRMAAFTDLVATALANVRARAEIARLLDEQAGLRRVATLVAREAPADEVFAAVAEEISRLFGGQAAHIIRYEPDGTATSVAATGTAVGIDDWTGVPVMVKGRPWGKIELASRERGSLPAEIESRLSEFAGLVATAISKLQARADLAASRARIVAAADKERRRLVRDLHDGAQQRLIHTVITLKLARNELGHESPYLEEALHEAEQAIAELRELAHGILPSVLAHGGLRAGVDALASRMPLPVDVGVSVARLPAPVEATAYFVVAEALTNVAKHAGAQHADVTARVDDGTLLVEVRDDGCGGARAEGSGLVGLADRLAAVDGRLEIESPPGCGTRIAATIPLCGAPQSG
jgi:signal transduction histidine kinase